MLEIKLNLDDYYPFEQSIKDAIQEAVLDEIKKASRKEARDAYERHKESIRAYVEMVALQQFKSYKEKA
jgi:hypothetical protein